MKKMVLVTTKNEVSVIDFPVEKPGDYMGELRGFYKAINCDCVQEVHARFMRKFIDDCKGLVMVVDEEGLIAGKQMNLVGSLFYGTQFHGSPIVGDILIMTEENSFDGPNLAGLEEDRAEAVAAQIRTIINNFNLKEGMD